MRSNEYEPLQATTTTTSQSALPDKPLQQSTPPPLLFCSLLFYSGICNTSITFNFLLQPKFTSPPFTALPLIFPSLSIFLTLLFLPSPSPSSLICAISCFERIMKQFNGGNGLRTSFCPSIFVKSVVCFLFLGLVYRFLCYSSSVLQFSPVFLGNNTGEPAAGLNISDSESLATPPPSPLTTSDHQTSHNVSAKCDLFRGGWIPDPDGPMYTNSTCYVIDGPQNCIRNGRPDSDYMYWRWKPRDCHLPKFDPNKFLNMMRRKSLAFIGDSIMRNHVQSLLCMLSPIEAAVDIYHDQQYKNRRWSFPSYQFNVSLVWSPFLTKAFIFEDDNGVSTGIIQIHLDEPDTVWTQQYKNHDYVVIAGGKWFLKSALYYENNTLIGCHNCNNPNITQLGFKYAYGKALHTTLKFITRSKYRAVTVLRSLAPDHFENGEWNSGGYCNRTRPFKAGEIEINDTDEVMRRAELEEFERAAAMAAENGVRLKLLDATYMSLLRPDGHPGAYRRERSFEEEQGKLRINDCLHWCLPGPIDSWNELVMEMVQQEAGSDLHSK